MMENDRILLRPWLESDAPALFKYASDPEVGPRVGWPPHKNMEERKETGEPIDAKGYGPSCQCNLPAREGEGHKLGSRKRYSHTCFKT